MAVIIQAAGVCVCVCVSDTLCACVFVLMNEDDSHVRPAGIPALAERKKL